MTRKPDVIFLGTSRTTNGLRCSHPALAENRCLDLSTYGSNVYEQYRYFQHALNTGELKTVIIGIDLFAFNNNKDVHEDFSENFLSITADGTQRSPGYLSEKAKVLLSVDTARSSIKTIRKSRRDIHKPEQRNFFTYERWKKYSEDYLNIEWFPPARPEFTLKPGSNSSLDLFRKMVRQAHDHGVDLKIFISPCHAWLWETMSAAGLWDEFEDLKRHLVQITISEAATLSRPAFSVWDFSGYNPVTTSAEPVQGASERGLGLYTDPAHYTHKVGDMVLDRIYNLKNTGFGVLLTANNIEQHLDTLRKKQQQYRKNHIELASMISTLADFAAAKRAGK